MSFYNPYMKTPDFGQGMQDLVNQILQMLMMKQMMGQGRQQQPTPPPQAGGNMMTGAGMQAPPQQMPQMPQGAGSPFGTQMPQIDPMMLQYIMQMMSRRQ